MGKSIKHMIVTVFNAFFVLRLIDPLNTRNRALPWNDANIVYTFSTLGEVMAAAAGEKTKKEMQKRFWEA